MRLPLKPFAAIVAAGTIALTAGACGNSSNAATNDKASASSTAPVAKLDNLTGEKTEVVVDAGFLSGLTSLKLTPGVVGTAKLADGTLSFPITGGNATYYKPGSVNPYVQGKIRHDGSGISLTDGKTKVELTTFVVDPAASVLTGDVSANGTSVVKGAPLFFLDGRTLEPLQVDKTANKAVLYGTTVSLTKEAAGLLNKTYGTTALTEFFKVGIARITLSLS